MNARVNIQSSSTLSLIALMILFAGNITFSKYLYAQNIVITQPRDKARVNMYGNTILFAANSPIDDTSEPIIFIMDPMQQWWPWFMATPNDNVRNGWQLSDVQIGGDKDRDREFQIQVLVVPKSDLNSGIKYQGNLLFIDPGSPFQNRIMVQVLRVLYPLSSNIITVTRN